MTGRAGLHSSEVQEGANRFNTRMRGMSGFAHVTEVPALRVDAAS
jgi:hypothetical protein